MSLRQTIERAAMDAEQLGGELLVPSCHLQHTADVVFDDMRESERRAGGRSGLAHGAHQLWRQIGGEEHRIRGQGSCPFDGVL